MATKSANGFIRPRSDYLRNCEACGKPFDTYNRPRGRFCSQACMGASFRRRIELTCAQCGQVYSVVPHKATSSRYCSKACQAEALRAMRGPAHPNWQPGRRSKRDGYVYVIVHGHPRADKAGRVPEHVLVAEQTIGRPLKPGEVVHHINRQKDDNRPENLMVLPSAAAHMELHRDTTEHARTVRLSRHRGAS